LLSYIILLSIEIDKHVQVSIGYWLTGFRLGKRANKTQTEGFNNVFGVDSLSVAEPHNFYAAPALGKNFDAAPAPGKNFDAGPALGAPAPAPAPAPTLLYSKTNF
jgi:hypothetical protein